MNFSFSWAEETSLRGKLLFLMASAYKVPRQTLLMISQSEKYVANTLSQLSRDGLIVITSAQPPVVKLTRAGVSLLQTSDPLLYSHYDQITNHGRPGYTPRHIENQLKAADVLVLMHCAEVCISSQKPTAEKIYLGEEEKNKYPSSVFYLQREIRYTDSQRESRNSLSRATGTIISPGIQALVYNTADSVMRMSKQVERSINIRTSRNVQDLYDGLPYQEIHDSIVISKSEEEAVRILTARTNKVSNTKYIGDAVFDDTVLRTNIRYIPLSREGAESLKLISRIPQQELLSHLFSVQEMQSAKARGIGDGIIGNLVCYEFVSCNLSKLAQIKKQHMNLSEVGIICRESQIDFVSEFLQATKLNVRVFEDEAMNELLWRKDGKDT